MMFSNTDRSQKVPVPQQLEQVAYGPKIDVWDLGVVWFYMLTGFPLFGDYSDERLRESI